MKRTRTRNILRTAIVLSIALLIFVALPLLHPGKPLPKAPLADGRILQIERVTFGTDHRVGFKSPIEKFRPWLPNKIYDLLVPKYPHSEIHLERPGLVVWVNAIDPITGKHVDCQSIRVDILGKTGDVFWEDTSSWFGGATFWRVGHVFYAFPRTEPTLVVQVTPWRTNAIVEFEVPNPHVTPPATWSGLPLPQHKLVGDLDVALNALRLNTHGRAKSYGESSSQYWFPVWELRHAGKPAGGWEEPEWIAEDPTGNRSQFLGVHQPVLRFSGTFYPSPTNTQETILLGSSPATNIRDLQSNIWWNLKLSYGKHVISAMGLFTNGTHVFLDGVYQTNPPVVMGPVHGGAPSGWIGQSQRVTPTRMNHWEGHYTPVPVIYAQAQDLGANERLAVRLRDNQGQYWLAKSESQGNSQGIKPFLVGVPSDVTTVVAEFVVLRPVQAEFTVQTPKSPPSSPPAPAGTPREGQEVSIARHKVMAAPNGNPSGLVPSDLANNPKSTKEATQVAGPSRSMPVTAAMTADNGELSSGDAFELQVRVRIAGGYHIQSTNAANGPFTSTLLTLTLPKDIEAQGGWSAPTPVRTKTDDSIYTDSVVFRRLLKVGSNAAPGKLSLSGELVCQACSEQVCWPPRTIPLSTSVTIRTPNKEQL